MPRRPFNRASTPKAFSIHGPKLILRGTPVVGSRRAKKRRRQVELVAQVVALEGRRDLLGELAVRVEPRHLVFVLVGHELEEVARDRVGERRRVGDRMRLGGPDALDRNPVALGVGAVLVSGQESDAAGDRLVERLGEMARGRRRLELAHQRGDALRLGGGAAAEREGIEVHGDGFAVEADGLLDGRGGQRHVTLLERIAEHEHVGRDGVAEDRRRHRGGVHEGDAVAAGRRQDGAPDALGRQREIGIAGEVAGQDLGRVDDKRRAPLLDGGEHPLGAGDDEIAAEDEMRRAGGDADGVDVVRRMGEAHVAVDGAALLGKAGHIDHAAALALEMRRHAEDGADRHDAGAADAGDDDVVGALDGGKRRLGELALTRRGCRRVDLSRRSPRSRLSRERRGSDRSVSPRAR